MASWRPATALWYTLAPFRLSARRPRPGEFPSMHNTKRVEKPWGYELIWAHTERYVGKLLHINQGHKLSLQYHVKKDETIHVQQGRLLFVVDEGKGLIERELTVGQSYHIKPNTTHRMVALTDCDVLEVSTPELDDVVRLEDSYGRKGTSAA